MTPKEKLVAQAQAAGLSLTGTETVTDLKALLAAAVAPDSQGEADRGNTAASDEANVPKPAPQAPAPESKASEVAVDAAPVAVGSKAAQMKAWLDTQPKATVFVPLAPGEKLGVTQSVILNGYHMYIRKGQQVVVPQPVAEILDEKLKHRMSIENHPNRLSGDGEVKMDKFGS